MTVENTYSPFQMLYDTQKAFYPLLYQEASFTENFEAHLRATAQSIIGTCKEWGYSEPISSNEEANFTPTTNENPSF